MRERLGTIVSPEMMIPYRSLTVAAQLETAENNWGRGQAARDYTGRGTQPLPGDTSMTTTSDFLRRLRTLAGRQTDDSVSDRQLLECFLHDRSEVSFEALVQRHGPMVLSVCRRVLRKAQDAEDAFQTTFLILANKASAIRKRESLSSWLYGVAYHSAECIKAKALRRAAHERRFVARPLGDETNDITWRELRSVLDEELQRLPEKYPAPLVLCYLEAKTQHEAARRLGWSKNTVGRRINQARQMLARRLTRRGVTLSAALAAPVLIENGATAAVPPLLAASTARAGIAVATGKAIDALVPAQVAALVEAGSRMLLMKKTAVALALLVSLVLGVGGLLAHRAMLCRTLAEAPAPPKAATPEPSSPSPRNASKVQGIEINGRVLDLDGKPSVGAHVFLLPKDNPKQIEKAARATTDKEGRFRIMAHPADFGPLGKGVLAATAKGFGLDWMGVDATAKNEDISLRLVADDVPIVGRVLDLEGKPIAGVAVRVLRVGKVAGGELKSWLDKNIAMRRNGTYLNDGGLAVLQTKLLDLPTPEPTGPDGTFRLTGFGRDRVVRLDIEGPDIVWRKMWVVTRPGPARGFIPGFWGVYPARFEYLAAPCKPIVGTVRERGSGKPLAGITVGSVNHGTVETTTDKNGRYRIVGVAKNPRYAIVAEGDYYFNCTKQDIADTSGLEPITVNFELERGILIHGRVTNKVTGEPVRGSVYYCALADNPNLKDFKELGTILHVNLRNRSDTAVDGSFSALGIPGSGLLCVRADDGAFLEAKPVDDKGNPLKPVPNIVLTGHHALVPVHVSEQDTKTHVYNIALDPGRSVKGKVVGPDGKPLAGVQIVGLNSTWTDADKTAQKDPEFTVRGVEPGRERKLIFCQEEKHLGKVLQLRGDEKGSLTVKLEPLGIVTGRMINAEGRPLAGLTVRVRQVHSTFDRQTTTDSDGKFRVESLLPRSKFLLAVAYGDPWKRLSLRVYIDEGLSVESGERKNLGDLKPKLPKGWK